MEECQPPAAPSPAASRGAETSVPRGNEARLCVRGRVCKRPRPCAQAAAQPRLSQLAQQDVAWWEVSCLLWEQLNVTAPEAPTEGFLPCGGAAGPEKVPPARGGARPGAEVRRERWRPPGAWRSCFIWARCPCWCVVRAHSQRHSSVRLSLSSGAGDRWPCPFAGPLPWPAGPRLPPCHLHGSCSRGRVRAPRGTKGDLRLHVLQAFCPLSPRWLQDGRRRQLPRRGQPQSPGVLKRCNSLKRLTRSAVN